MKREKSNQRARAYFFLPSLFMLHAPCCVFYAFMLPKKRKLNTEDFKFMRGANSFSSVNFLVQRKRKIDGSTRFGVVTAKFVDASAVARNKIKRQIFSAIRSVLPECGEGNLVVIRVKKGAENLKAKEKKNEILGLLKRAGITRATPPHFEGSEK